MKNHALRSQTETTVAAVAADKGYVHGAKAFAKYAKTHGSLPDSAKTRATIAGAIDAITHPETDYSNGATSWDGRDLGITNKNDPYYNSFRRNGGFIYGNPSDDVFKTGPIQRGGTPAPKTGKFDYEWLSTTHSADTVFWKDK